MDQAELIYSVEQIFSDCLQHYNNAVGFHIAPYQRGYKWGSNENEPVMRLIKDIHKSFLGSDKNQSKEHYLQYITLKPIKIEGYAWLEVIDGQQRLTTLSVLLAVLHNINNNCGNAANHKIHYALSKSFLDNWMYNNNVQKIIAFADWTEFIKQHPEENKQDIYYLFQAAKALNDYIVEEIPEEEYFDFYEHLSSNIKLIVNAVETHVVSEKVFRNLNSIKVPLTEAELIKALLLTKGARDKEENYKPRRFKEIMDVRTAMGRQWDEMQTHLNNPQIKSVFFPEQTDVMQAILRLTALLTGYEPIRNSNEKYPLFEFFQNQIQENQVSTINIFKTTVLIYKLLLEWHKDDTIYNALGFLFYNKSAKEDNVRLLKDLLSKAINENKTPIKTVKILIFKHLSKLEKDDVKNLDFREDKPKIHDLLLLINLFPDTINRFNFDEYHKKNWSLEHVFPQTPNLAETKLDTAHKKDLKEIVNNPERWAEIELLLNKVSLDQQEVAILNEKLKAAPGLLNNIGNLALLPIGENAAVGNKLFFKKREIISKKISEGRFVPSHTFNVFSKLILPETKSLNFWNKKDIIAHQEYIGIEIEKIKKRLLLS